MRSIHLVAVPFLALLAACGGTSENGGSADGQPAPGMYMQKVSVTNIEFPDMTELSKKNISTQMEQAAGNGQTFCMGKQGTPDWKQAVSEMSKGMGGTCTDVERKETATSLDLHLQCKGTPKGDVDMKFAAKATESSFSAKIDYDFVVPETDETAKLTVETSAERMGDCPST